MKYSGLMLVGHTYTASLDASNNEIDDDTPDDLAASAKEVPVVSLMPVRVWWGARVRPTHPKVRRAATPIRFILDDRFTNDFWEKRHKDAVFVRGEYQWPDQIKVTKVIDINDQSLLAWE